jgi:4-alpha-glucanotransferase
LRSILSALGLACENAEDARASLARFENPTEKADLPPLLTTRVGEAVALPACMGRPAVARVTFEDGSRQDVALAEGAHAGAVLPGISASGYHHIEAGSQEVSVAVAPPRCLTAEDIAPGERIWGLAAQIYGLRQAGDGGIGDLGAVAALAVAAGARGADALMLSPTHALFLADPGRFSPYSPSTRLFHNPLHADPAVIMGADGVRDAVEKANLREEMDELEKLDLIDWPRAAQTKLRLLRALFDSFERRDLGASQQTELAADFAQFRAQGGLMLARHACFEVLHADRLRVDGAAWNWRSWPRIWRDPSSQAVTDFAAAQHREVLFHTFLQWLAVRSIDRAQLAAKHAGMRIGLISDLAVGMDNGGSHAWSRPGDVMIGLSVGAPPDYYSAEGQNWGLTTFSPRALVAEGFAPYIATLRAALQHAGGVRIDHVMGLMRLWLIPEGAKATEGAYVSYPIESLFRLTALESVRHRAVVIGEDLGTLPHGFRERLDGAGIAGMQVLRFERDAGGHFREPSHWRPTATAMTITHDLPPTAGWWKGHDIEERAKLGKIADESAASAERSSREEDRQYLWAAFRHAGVASTEQPPLALTGPAVDAAARFIAASPCHLAILSLEDVLGEVEQPNMPGTVNERPNWRIRQQGEAAQLLGAPSAQPRLEAMKARSHKKAGHA